MPFQRVIPCLDVADGAVVKGVNFENLATVGDPVALARCYSDGGADELVFLDITATVNARDTLVRLVAAVADAIAIPFTVGGGVRSVDDAARLIAAGADRVSINSAALARPSLLSDVAQRYGSQAVVCAIDVNEDDVVCTHGGRVATEWHYLDWATEAVRAGAGEVLLTSIGRDGTRAGYDLPRLRALAGRVTVPVIASGGAGSVAHVAEVLTVVDAALVASIVHENPHGLRDLRRAVSAAGGHLRPEEEQ